MKVFISTRYLLSLILLLLLVGLVLCQEEDDPCNPNPLACDWNYFIRVCGVRIKNGKIERKTFSNICDYRYARNCLKESWELEGQGMCGNITSYPCNSINCSEDIDEPVCGVRTVNGEKETQTFKNICEILRANDCGIDWIFKHCGPC